MNRESMSSLLKSLDDVEDKILLLKLYDEKNYEHFSEKIASLRKALVDLDDDRNIHASNAASIIENVAHLEIEVNEFMKDGEVRDDSTLSFGTERKTSGEEAAKQHAVGVFKELAQVVGSMNNIDIDRLRKLKQQWEDEKTKHRYSEAEVLAIEESLANSFLDYQIKTCATEGRLPSETQDDFCMPQVYERVLKKRIIDYASTLEKGSLERLDLESFCINWDLNRVLTSPSVWQGLSGVAPTFPVHELGGKAEEGIKPIIAEGTKKVPSTPAQENPSNLPLNLNEQARGNSVLVVYEKKLPDGSVELKRKIKALDEDGHFRLFFNKDRVVELYFLEGTKQLSFTQGGNSKSRYNHLSEFPNLRNVYLPSSLRFIEQGYFMNCDNLDHVFLGKGTHYKPNQQLFPEGAKVVESKEKADNSVVIQELDEKAALFTQNLPTGKKTLKVRLKEGGLLPKSFVRAGYPGLEEVRYTKGVKNVGYQYWTQEYESILVKGGKYSNIQGLKRVILPEGMISLDNETFANCESLEEVTMPSGIELIPYRAFLNCKRLKDFKMPGTIKKIDQKAFQGCTSLKNIELPWNLVNVEDEAFLDCEGIESVHFPDNCRLIGPHSFKNCNKLKDLVLPRKMHRISEGAFENCAGLRSICLPDEVQEVVFDAFKNCVGAESVLLPRTFKKFEPAFKGCQSLRYGIDQSEMTNEDIEKIFPRNYFIKLFKGYKRADENPQEFLDEEVKRAKEILIKKYTGKKKEDKTKEPEEKTVDEKKDDDIEK